MPGIGRVEFPDTTSLVLEQKQSQISPRSTPIHPLELFRPPNRQRQTYCLDTRRIDLPSLTFLPIARLCLLRQRQHHLLRQSHSVPGTFVRFTFNLPPSEKPVSAPLHLLLRRSAATFDLSSSNNTEKQSSQSSDL